MRAKSWRSLIGLLILVFITSTPLTAGAQGKDRKNNPPPDNPTTTSPTDDTDSLRRFSMILDMVESNYVEEKERKEIVDGAIKGMLQSLDPHSVYLSPEEYNEMMESNTGEFFGIGIEISSENGQVTIVAPIEDTPADRAGLKSGDLILAVDGRPTQDMSSQETVSSIRGPKGTTVELLVMSKGSNTPRTVKIIRDAIPMTSVKMRELENGYYWIRITRFIGRTNEELSEALRAAAKKGEIKGIVLDMRNNPGGLLDQSIYVSDMFLNDGLIVSVRGRTAKANRTYSAHAQAGDVVAPMVVLINSGSASAAEIVAGALKDHNRALLVGERTFGKASVQDVIALPDGSGIKLTVARYYTPSGLSIQADGIAPDIEMPFEAPAEKDPNSPSWQIREQNLARHLENENGSKDKAKPVDEEVAKFLEQDNQLRMGLQLVKGLPRFKEVK